MKKALLSALCVGVVILACTEAPSAPDRPRLLASMGTGTGCPQTYTGGEIYGTDYGVHSTRSVSLIPVYRPSQWHTTAGAWDSQTAGYGCESDGDWSWVGADAFTDCSSAGENHAGFSGTEIHCVRPGRFLLGGGVPLDWTRYPYNAGNGIMIEDLTAMNTNATGAESDVVVNTGMSFTDTITPKVRYDFTSSPTSTSFGNTLLQQTSPGSGVTDSIVTSSGSAYLRIGAWEAMPNNGLGHMLVQYRWNGTDDGTASGFANDYGEYGLKFVRVHQMPEGCGHVVVAFQPANTVGEGGPKFLTIPYRVGSSCQAQLSVTATGGGSVTSWPSGISTSGTQSAYFNFGASVLLAASPPAHYDVAWTGCTGGQNCTVTMDASKSVTATFTQVPLYIDGPTEVTETGSYIWFAIASNCGLNCTYSWYKRPYPNGSYAPVGNNKFKLVVNVTQLVAFQLKVVVSDGTNTWEATQVVAAGY